MQIRALERAKSSGNFSSVSLSQPDFEDREEDEETGEAGDDSNPQPGQSVLVDKTEPQRKKVKI